MFEQFMSLFGGGGGQDATRGMFTGTPDGVGPMQPGQQGMYDGLMGGGGGGASPGAGGKTSKYAAPTEAQDMALGMSALEHYKDMSNYANMGSLMSPLQGMQSMGQGAMQFQDRGGIKPIEQNYQDPYIMSLMGIR